MSTKKRGVKKEKMRNSAKGKGKMSTKEKNQYDEQAEKFLTDCGLFWDSIDEQAEKFLTDCGLTFKATRSGDTPPPWSEPGERSGLRYWITIARAGKGTRARLSFPFWDSIAAREAGTEPRAYDVLACISGDIYTPETFWEFCAEYGYDEDSRKGYAAFKRCDRFARRLRAFFTAQEQERLAEIR